MANIKRANTSGITKSGIAIPDVPDAPTIGAATNVGTSRAFNNGSATVAFTASATGGTPASYTATSTPGSYTAAGAGSPLTVTGLQSATSYTFAVTATNASTTGPASSASSSITATTVPQVPGTPTATRTNNTTASLAFTAGATGGSAITSYTVTSSPSIALSTSSTTSPLSVTGSFVKGTSYTFTIVAVNANGSSTASSASNSLNPNPYAIGDTGPGGGKVFYDAGSTLSWGRYLEAAPNTWSGGVADPSLVWSGNLTTLVGTSLAIGTGHANTSAMIAQNGTTPRAGTSSRAYAGGSMSNWSLGSRDEMMQLAANQSSVGGFIDGYYWCSSEGTAGSVWVPHVLGNYYGGPGGKDSPYPVRPVRAF